MTKQIKIKRCKLAEVELNRQEAWEDPTKAGFIVEWCIMMLYNGFTSKELDNVGIDFVSEGGKTFQVKSSRRGHNNDFKRMIKEYRNAQYLVLVYIDVKEKRVTYTIN